MVDVRAIQLEQISILKEILKVCDRHNIKYFAIGGTVLGAVRHKGFIPWDDDIDLGMPLKEYRRFIKYAKEELPSHLEILEDNKDFPLWYIKVHNINTTFIEKNEIGKPQRYKGVWVDIMPFSGVPNSIWGRKLFYKVVKKTLSIQGAHRYFENLTSKQRLLKLIPDSIAYFIWRKAVTMFDFYKKDYTAFNWSYRIDKLTFPRKIFDELVLHEFEDICILIPKDYDAYLTRHYGEYMTLPPIEQRIVHNNDGIVDLNKSYKEYRKEHISCL